MLAVDDSLTVRSTQPSRPEPALLEAGNLRVTYFTRNGGSQLALDGASLRISAGHSVGVVGESGSGKSTLALAIGGLLPPNARVDAGFVRFRGKDLLGIAGRELRKIRGAQIAWIFQEPARALNPVLRVGNQIAEVIRAHGGGNRGQRRASVKALLRRLQLPDTDGFLESYPHEISGGQRQRIVIAQALACGPALLIADEPTTAIDTITQAEIVGLLGELREQLRLSLLIITHNPAMLAGLADHLIVMQAGRIVEEGRFEEVCRRPSHPYTSALLYAARANTTRASHAGTERPRIAALRYAGS